MTPDDTSKLEHLTWAIRSRDRNQRCAVRLLRLFIEHKEQWETKDWARPAQELLSVSFSLWRAAFLADKTAKRSAVFSDATAFLEKIIEDNAISYVQDRKCNEWTFNYYTRNARAALETLHKYWPAQVPNYAPMTRTPKQRWDYCQDLLDAAVENFEALFDELAKEKIAHENAVRQKRERRFESKSKRKKVREITFANRASGSFANSTASGNAPLP